MGKLVDMIYLEFSKSFDTISHSILVSRFLALDCLLGAHGVPAPRDVIDPGAEGLLQETEEEEEEEEEEGSESQEPASSLPRTRDPRGTPQSCSPVSSEAGEASTSAAPGPAGRTTPPAAAARARASRRARNQEEYQRRHLRFMEQQIRIQEHWVQEDLRLRRRSLEALEEQGRALRGHLQSLLNRFPIPPAPPTAKIYVVLVLSNMVPYGVAEK
ncbi:uncharacterized protein LOC142819163 [Pelodiscus sinensis]|uniref:uncharacterized protein LOC142819163 n=1 Tax=Pelodiscus sinensis TaxID=13735 RepID=UPI003F6C7902